MKIRVAKQRRRETKQRRYERYLRQRRRVIDLCEAVVEWQQLSQSGEYPRSLRDILATAMAREYRFGQRTGLRHER